MTAMIACAAIVIPLVRGHMVTVSVSKLLALLIAVAMLFAPLSVQGGAAMAAMPSDHHAQMTEGHCGEQPTKSADRESDGKSCCLATCAAIAVAPFTPLAPHAFVRGIDRPAPEQSGPSFLAELPTPPPRVA